MEKIEDSELLKHTELKSSIPYSFTRFILDALGAMPCTWRKPYFPSRDLKNSTFLYCILIYGVTLVLACLTIKRGLEFMKEAYPFNHFVYIITFEFLTTLILNIITFVSCADTRVLAETVHAWYELIEKYEKTMCKPIPNCKKNEIFCETMILISVLIGAYVATLVLEPEIHCDLIFYPAFLLPLTIQVSIGHHWIGHNLTLNRVAKELSQHMKQCVDTNAVTANLIQEYKDLWLLLRNIIDKMSNMRTPLYLCMVLFLIGTVISYEATLYYFRTGDKTVTCLHLLALSFYMLPLFHLGWTSQAAADQVQHLFENGLSSLKLDSVCEATQKQICVTYLIKKTRPPVLRLFDYKEVNLSVSLSTISAMLMYVFTLIQFHEMLEVEGRD